MESQQAVVMQPVSESLKVEPAQLRSSALVLPTGIEETQIARLFDATSAFLKDAVQRQAIDTKAANEWAGIIANEPTFAGAMNQILPMVYYMPITQQAASTDFGGSLFNASFWRDLDGINAGSAQVTNPWPVHCVIGTDFAQDPGLAGELKAAVKIAKGDNPRTEAFDTLSALNGPAVSRRHGNLLSIDVQQNFVAPVDSPPVASPLQIHPSMIELSWKMQLLGLGMPDPEVRWWKEALAIHGTLKEQGGASLDNATLQVVRLFTGKVERYERIHDVQREFGSGRIAQRYLSDTAGILKVIPAVPAGQ